MAGTVVRYVYSSIYVREGNSSQKVEKSCSSKAGHSKLTISLTAVI
jgi:hypothetical protein